MRDREQVRDRDDISLALAGMAEAIHARHPDLPVLVGIRRGGVPLSESLAGLLAGRFGERPLLGVVDINLYRDDWTRARSFPKVGRTEMPLSLEDRRVILVDDVLYTGRTVRAALGILSEFGRASRVELATLVDRGHREMPIQPDYAAFVIATSAAEMVEVNFSADGSGQDITLIRA
ncbi:MAG: bifunctional pyr operon transcriptional regulator/uracil phosphoribosyltransferase PyrR [Deltaproteobacteria bacterium]|jgi:pyrimidine operon attenuation protein/uracil phosphoribosyltransferase|nr:bifunctional pyr operon transcriptional regulator/uracil phosphoribosyltransferase PyrR [Deltaproteobacteria bacterium]